MKRSIIALGAAASLVLIASPTYAQRGNGRGPKPKSSVTKVNAQGSGAPKVKAQGSGAPKAPKTTTQTKATTHPKTTTQAKGPKATHDSGPKTTTASNGKSKSSSTTVATTTTTTTPTTPTTPLTPVQQKLQKNTNLANKLQDRLPPGTNLMRAAADFDKLGHFVSAVNVSNNLKIPFADLKKLLVTDGYSLGQAIKELRPLADSTVEVRRADRQALEQIQDPEIATIDPVNSTTKPKSKQGGGR
jgi:hypothetical protein